MRPVYNGCVRGECQFYLTGLQRGGSSVKWGQRQLRRTNAGTLAEATMCFFVSVCCSDWCLGSSREDG
jgi:hypothetical protein